MTFFDGSRFIKEIFLKVGDGNISYWLLFLVISFFIS